MESKTNICEVSIIIPCYNVRPDFLRQAVDSARNQDFSAKEIILIDDGSTAPETIAEIDRLPEDVRVIRQYNQGLAAARNHGFRAAAGRYVLPLDGDDWIESYFVQRAYQLISEDEDAFVYPWGQTFGEYSIPIRGHITHFGQLFTNSICCCMLIPKTLWCRVGGYDESQRTAADWDFNFRLMLAGAQPVCLDEPAFHYRVSFDSMLWSQTGRMQSTVLRRLRKKYPDCYRPSEILRRLRLLPVEQRGYKMWRLLMFYAIHRLFPERLVNKLFFIRRLLIVRFMYSNSESPIIKKFWRVFSNQS